LIRAASIAALWLLTLSACDRGVLVTEKWEWKDQQWISGDKKSFVMEATDTSTVYQMDIQVSHDEKYGFQNLYVKTLTTYPSGKEVASITSLELINDDGSWAGDKGNGGRKVDIPLQQRFTFPEAGKYTWTVEPYMRMDTIQGINSLKVTCRKVKE